VTAFVVLRQGEKATEAEMIEHCRAELSAFKCPKKVFFVEALPKSPTGKILKRELRTR
jgi:fatty-acyl-CoA synthase